MKKLGIICVTYKNKNTIKICKVRLWTKMKTNLIPMSRMETECVKVKLWMSNRTRHFNDVTGDDFPGLDFLYTGLVLADNFAHLGFIFF